MIEVHAPIAKRSAQEFVITRAFFARRERMLKAWTDPKLLAQWWGPRSITNEVCELDVRSGGAYRIVMRSPDGLEYPLKGVFREVTTPSRLVLAMDCSEHPAAWHDLVKPGRAQEDSNPAGEMVMTVTIEPMQGQTRLTVRIRFQSPAIRDAMLKMGIAEGWSQSLDRLAHVMADTAGRELVASRVLDAPRNLVFEAFTQPKHLAQWWGPKGFTNTFHEFDLRPGGIWRFTMRGPNGAGYENVHVFLGIVRPGRFAMQHISPPRFELTVTLIEEGGKAQLTWHMFFDTAEECEKVKSYALESIEQTFDRLEAELAKMTATEGRAAA
jgi:uncharacterized protein YndB with AHSA1/START domain